jgi:hypothetical protein
VARLRLQIACRSADRHRRLEGDLAELFGDEAFAIYELLPLSDADVTEFAHDAGVDADSFIAEVVARNLASLASRPLTLRFLLAAAKSGGGLPDSITDLYFGGCKLLLEEPDEDRRSGSVAELSDWLKRWLDSDLRGRGIIVGREVEVRPGPRGKMGESGDLVVEAPAGERVEGSDIVSVTIEVKGCWHSDVAWR